MPAWHVWCWSSSGKGSSYDECFLLIIILVALTLLQNHKVCFSKTQPNQERSAGKTVSNGSGNCGERGTSSEEVDEWIVFMKVGRYPYKFCSCLVFRSVLWQKNIAKHVIWTRRMLWITVDGRSWQSLNDDQDGGWVNVFSGTGSPG